MIIRVWFCSPVDAFTASVPGIILSVYDIRNAVDSCYELLFGVRKREVVLVYWVCRCLNMVSTECASDAAQ